MARRQAPALLAAIDHALDAVAETVERPREGAGAAFGLRARNGDSHPMLGRLRPNLPAAVALIADDPMGSALGTARATPLDSPGLHAWCQDDRLVPLSRGAHEGHQLATPCGAPVDLGTDPAPAAAQGFGRWAPLFAPAACWWARIIVPSLQGTSPCRWPWASAWACTAAKSWLQMPACCQR